MMNILYTDFTIHSVRALSADTLVIMVPCWTSSELKCERNEGVYLPIPLFSSFQKSWPDCSSAYKYNNNN
jgi:hypothetical protein